MNRSAAILATVLAFAGAPVLAQPHAMAPMPGVGAGPGAENPPAMAYRQVQEAMMHGMSVPLTGDPDRDFVNGMLPHHEGAVGMAQVELRFGRDPVLRRLARDIVATQEKEMRLMREWQRRHPAP